MAMNPIARVSQWIRTTLDDAKITEVQVDSAGGLPFTADHYAPAGVDAPPLEGDTAVVVDAQGNGRLAVVGYMDTRNEGAAQPGGVRFYSRDSEGTVRAVIWIKEDGNVDITSANGGIVIINGVEIDGNGNVTAPGDVVALSGPSQVALSTHEHPTAMGPSGPPTPGT